MKTTLLALAIVGTSGVAHADPQAAGLSASMKFGAGYLDGSDASQGAAWAIGLEHRFAGPFALRFDGDFISYAHNAADPTLSRQLGTIAVGAGVWVLPSLELHGGVGAAHQILIPYGSVNPFSTRQGSWGPAAVIAADWLPIGTDTWRAGFALRGSYAHFGSTGNSFAESLMFAFELRLATARASTAPAIAKN